MSVSLGIFGIIQDSRLIHSGAGLYSVCSFNNEQEILLSINHAQLHPKRINDRALMDMASEFLSVLNIKIDDVDWHRDPRSRLNSVSKASKLIKDSTTSGLGKKC